VPFHNYAGPGTLVEQRIYNKHKPVSGLDKASLVHDLEYIRDKTRTHADNHMATTLFKEYPLNPQIASLSRGAFYIDQLLNGNKRMGNDIAKYDQLSKIAVQEKLIDLDYLD